MWQSNRVSGFAADERTDSCVLRGQSPTPRERYLPSRYAYLQQSESLTAPVVNSANLGKRVTSPRLGRSSGLSFDSSRDTFMRQPGGCGAGNKLARQCYPLSEGGVGYPVLLVLSKLDGKLRSGNRHA